MGRVRRSADLPSTPGVFVPRRRSESLVMRGGGPVPAGAVVVDLCCGSGALGAAWRTGVPTSRCTRPTSIRGPSPVPVGTWRPTRVFLGDLFDALPSGCRGEVDMLLVNAPYVPSDAVALMPREARLYEPRQALDGGPDGLDLHRRVAAEALGVAPPRGRTDHGNQRGPRRQQLRRIFAYARLLGAWSSDDELDATVAVATRATSITGRIWLAQGGPSRPRSPRG